MSAVAIFEERRRENADTIAMIRVLILLRVSSILEYRPFALSETIQSSSANVLLPTGIVCRNQMQRLLWRSYQNRNRYKLELRPFPSQNECKQEQDLPGFFPPVEYGCRLGAPSESTLRMTNWGGSLSVSFVAEAGGTAKPPRIQAAVVIDAAIL